MRFYRRTLIEAARALVVGGELDMRLTHVAGCLIQLDDDDVPPGALDAFERLRDPLIATPLVVRGAMVPRGLGAAEAGAAALGVLDLLVAELGGPS